ncbi:hypothetical protein M413DRAFT_166108 [Hebeloma cylindrosporum]|uniref:F-box domain-containing protein n=1 Tax=Hebeloma cylindrosporum TaxID=76867 RepID=A0A0C3BVN1_HEBCY|nr:hypothetical protein M413DRAFT_166108 [Hebeloma cylindrosporum h7]
MVRSRSSTRLSQSPPVLPLDVCGIIIDILASDYGDHLVAVKKCSLVCQLFLHLCRKHIFSTIQMSGSPESEDSDGSPYLHAMEKFLQLINHTPEIGNYIRHLELIFEEGNYLDDFPRIVQCLTSLESLTIYEPLNWRSLQWPVRNALLRLMYLPTLTHLRLCDIDNFLVTDLIHAANLRRLEVRDTSFFKGSTVAPPTPKVLPAKSIRLRELVLSPRMNSSGIEEIANAKCSDGLPLIDPTELTTISVWCMALGDIHILDTFLKRSEQLTKVDLNVHRNLALSGFGSMLSPHIRTLKIARFSITIRGRADCPLGGICGVLERIAGENVLQSLSIAVHIWGANNMNGVDWGTLDAVLTSSGWPALKRVFLTVFLLSGARRSSPRSNEWVKKEQFPRLMARRNVDFRFEVC